MYARMCNLRLVFSAFLVVLLGMTGSINAQAQTTYSGRAYAAHVNTSLTGPVYLSDTGALPESGGNQGAGLLSYAVPGVLSANVLNASTSGANGKADSSASLVDVDVLSGHPAHLTASFVRSQTQATCDGLSGSSEIVELTFGGQTVAVTGEPNQTVTLPGVATLIINEQAQTRKGRYGQVRVNALHLIVPGVAEVILSASESDINCVPPTAKAPCHDFVTGGGWILTPTGDKGNFGFHAGIKNDVLSGHLHYIDHGARVKVKSTKILVYSATGPTSRHIEGEAEIDGVPGTFSVDVSDEGEPGRADTFSIRLSTGYAAAGTLQGGNLQLHTPCKTSTSTSPASKGKKK